MSSESEQAPPISKRADVRKTVYLVRHGESEANVTAVLQGPDSPLTAQGRTQAEAIAARAQRLSFDALIASPFARARDTAEAIARTTEKEITYSDLFVERLKPSSINGKRADDPVARPVWQEWERALHVPGLRVEDGENYDDLVARADAALTFLLDHPAKHIFVVTHGFFLRTMMARIVMGEALTGATHAQFQQSFITKNTGLTVFQYSSFFGNPHRWRITVFNDHAHLG